MTPRRIALFVCLSLVTGRAHRGRAEDASAPSLALPTDVASRAPRFVLAVQVRAPWSRTYGLALGYAACRFLALEAAFGIDESRRPVASAGLSLRPMGGGLVGPLLRLQAAHRGPATARPDHEDAFSVQALAGASHRLQTTYVEAVGGGDLRLVGGPRRLGFVLEARFGFVF